MLFLDANNDVLQVDVEPGMWRQHRCCVIKSHLELALLSAFWTF